MEYDSEEIPLNSRVMDDDSEEKGETYEGKPTTEAAVKRAKTILKKGSGLKLNIDLLCEKLFHQPLNKYRQNHAPLALQHPYRAVICAPSGGGKGYLLTQIKLSKDLDAPFDHQYIFTNSPDQSIFDTMKAVMGDRLTIYRDGLKHAGEVFQELQHRPDIDKTQICCVFDDIVGISDTAETKLIEAFFERGRPINVSSMALVQRIPRKFSTNARSNVTHWFLFKPESLNDLKQYPRELNLNGIEDKTLIQLFRSAYPNKFDYVLFDNKADDPRMRIRSNWAYPLLANYLPSLT